MDLPASQKVHCLDAKPPCVRASVRQVRPGVDCPCHPGAQQLVEMLPGSLGTKHSRCARPFGLNLDDGI